jgi:hypothetical protein
MFANNHHLQWQLSLRIANRTFRRARMRLPLLIGACTICPALAENVSQRYSDQLANVKPPENARRLRPPFPPWRVQMPYSLELAN